MGATADVALCFPQTGSCPIVELQPNGLVLLRVPPFSSWFNGKPKGIATMLPFPLFWQGSLDFLSKHYQPRQKTHCTLAQQVMPKTTKTLTQTWPSPGVHQKKPTSEPGYNGYISLTSVNGDPRCHRPGLLGLHPAAEPLPQ